MEGYPADNPAYHCLYARNFPHMVTFGIFHLVNVHREIDGAHNSVTELLVDQLLDRFAINQINFVKPVKKRIFWDVEDLAFGGAFLERQSGPLRQAQE